jgi:glycosyltransferase involved in cell wall biosynthesis
MKLAIIILTYNEEIHIGRALKGVEKIATETWVVDSGSTDNTVSIARAHGAKVVRNGFVNQSQQFQWALDNLCIESDWVMRLDADEILTPELVSEIGRRLPQLSPNITGVNVKRRHIFFGRWIKHGGRYPVTLLRIWRRGLAKMEQRWMDEHMVLLQGCAVTFSSDFYDHNLKDLTAFTDKHNKYATREAIEVLRKKYDLDARSGEAVMLSAADRGFLKRCIKERVYNHLPLWFGPLCYFVYRYVVLLGFLDGGEGLVYHFLQGFWYRFLVASKVWEWERSLRHLADSESRVETLARLTGYSTEHIASSAHDRVRP